MTIPRRAFLKLLTAMIAPAGWAATPHAEASRLGREFLAGLFDPQLGLLPEFLGAKTYWLWHDNYLAAKVLSQSHPGVARSIVAAIQREGIRQSDGKTELFFGEGRGVLPFRQYDLIEVRKIGDKVIRTEVATERVMTGWESYADLLFIASIAEGKHPAAKVHWDSAMKLWDGKGFVDAAFKEHRIYATYKLALALLAGRKLSPPADFPPALLEQLLALQIDSGGWITDYDADGKRIGVANVETSCLAILAIEESPHAEQPFPN